MTFAEFQIRLFAYKSVQLKEWEKIRFMAWCSLIGAHQDVKKMPKSIEAFMPLDTDRKNKNSISEEMKKQFLKEYELYLNSTNNGKVRN